MTKEKASANTFTMTKLCVVAAGGTGGHMFPAEALAREMAARGWRVVLATDHRGEQYAHDFPAEERLALDAATGRGPIGMLKAGVAIVRGVRSGADGVQRGWSRRRRRLRRLSVGPGPGRGHQQKRPTLIHEQNAVLGRTNRLLAPRVGAVASSFPTLERASPAVKARAQVVGNPVRADIRALFDRAYARPDGDGPIHVLVTGGSQGARLLSETTPRALAALPEAMRTPPARSSSSRAPRPWRPRARSISTPASRPRSRPSSATWRRACPQAHLVIGRAGASTCSELAVAGHAVDPDPAEDRHRRPPALQRQSS